MEEDMAKSNPRRRERGKDKDGITACRLSIGQGEESLLNRRSLLPCRQSPHEDLYGHGDVAQMDRRLDGEARAVSPCLVETAR